MQNLSDDDCNENEKFELPKITKLPSFTEYQKRSEVSLRNVRRFRLYKNTCLIFCKNVVHLSVFLVAKYIRLTCNLRLYSNHGCRDKVK